MGLTPLGAETLNKECRVGESLCRCHTPGMQKENSKPQGPLKQFWSPFPRDDSSQHTSLQLTLNQHHGFCRQDANSSKRTKVFLLTLRRRKDTASQRMHP